MIIDLLRHGQTTGDIENRYGGAYDDHITDLGKKQAIKLAESLVGKKVEKLFASPLIRAQETSVLIGDKLGLTAATLDGFKERNSYGILTGLTKEEAAQKYPELVELLKDYHNTIKGAEPFDTFQTRLTDALDGLAGMQFGRVAVVTHGGPIRVVHRDFLKLGDVDVANCAHMVLEAADGKFKLIETSGVTALNA